MKQFYSTKWLMSLLVILSHLQGLSQGGIVKGKITDNNTKEPIPGATITVKQTNLSSITNTSGEFSIQASDGDDLLISSVGFDEFQIKAKGTFLSIALNNSAR